MKLDSISIKKFRSIDNCELTNFEGFNVLIGKNNSGKSNILTAINAFFTCLREGSVATVSPPVGEEIDFYNRMSVSNIEIAVSFTLTSSEKDDLIQSIVEEAAQMKNATESLEPSLRLCATVKVMGEPRKLGFVSRLSLCSTVRGGNRKGDTERVILSISDEAALELRDKLIRSQLIIEDVDRLNRLLNRFDADDWRVMRRSETERVGRSTPSVVMSNILARESFGGELLNTVTSMITDAASLEEFNRAIQVLSDNKREEAEGIEREPMTKVIGTFAGEETSVPIYVRKLLARIAEIKVLHLPDRRNPIGPEEAQRLLSLKVQRGGEQVMDNIQETVSALLGVHIDAFQSESPPRRRDPRGRTLEAEMDVDNFLAQVNGSGIREALRVVLDNEFEHPDIMLVEEPEIHLHPAFEISMMRYLKRVSLDCQVFITTHSTNFLDTAEMRNIYLISKPDSTKVQLLDFEEAEAQIPNELGIRLSSLFMFDALMFVEGPTDEAILREWASTLGINLGRSSVGFVHMGGARNFGYFASGAILSFLKKRQVTLYFLMDRDEKDEPEITKLQDTIGENAVVKVLNKREIENYLICPRALGEFIYTKQKLASGKSEDMGIPINVDEVRKSVEDTVEKLKHVAVNNRVARLMCRPIYPRLKLDANDIEAIDAKMKVGEEIQSRINELTELNNKVEKVFQEQADHVNSTWETNKLGMVPGDLLLDTVCKEYDVRFSKRHGDGVRLAALMRQEEIDGEIRQILTEIGAQGTKSAHPG